MKYYVYGIYRKNSDIPFYIGSGTADVEDVPSGRIDHLVRPEQPKLFEYVMAAGGTDSVESKIITWCETRDLAYKEEARITQHYLDAGVDLANIDIGTHHGREHVAKQRQSLIASGKVRGELNGFYGKKHTPETIAYLREHCGNPGENNPRYGIKLTDEFKQVISETTRSAMARPEVKSKLKAGIRKSRDAIKFPINEIFLSISGEGPTAGLPTVFIRTYGCLLNCTYCDSRYACEGGEFAMMTMDEIVETIENIAPGIRNICLTGGECMMLPNITKLLSRLNTLLYHVEVETCGAVDLSAYHKYSYIHYVVDYKTSTSGMKDRMVAGAFSCLKSLDTVKFVVGSISDMDEAIQAIHEYNLVAKKCNLYFSPVFGMIEPKDIVEYLLSHRMWNCRVQVQLHKIIWDPNKRGV